MTPSLLKFLTPLLTNKHFITWAPLVVLFALVTKYALVAHQVDQWEQVAYAVSTKIVDLAGALAMLMPGLDRNGLPAAPEAQRIANGNGKGKH